METAAALLLMTVATEGCALWETMTVDGATVATVGEVAGLAKDVAACGVDTDII